MLLGDVDSLEVEDAAPTAASLWTLHRWIEKVAACIRTYFRTCNEKRLRRWSAYYADNPGHVIASFLKAHLRNHDGGGVGDTVGVPRPRVVDTCGQ
jgi:hypothetical protein